MSIKCGNCGANLSCGCQRKTASNGASCCSICLNSYEQKLKGVGTINPTSTVWPGIDPNAPTNISVNVTRT